MSDDPLCDALAVADAHAVSSGGFTARGRWAIRLHGPDRLKFVAVVRGSCLLVSEDVGEPVRLDQGDVVVSDGDRPYVLCSELGLRPLISAEVPRDPESRMARIGTDEDGQDSDVDGDAGCDAGAAGGASGETVCISGHIDLSRDRGGLLRGALPELIHVRGDAAEAVSLRWLITQMLDEMTSGRAGAEVVADYLAQLMFVHVLRISLTEAGSLPPGWLRALADERLAPALRLMHGEPGHPWQLEDLARAAAMSRTSFALRFRQAVGVPPLTYLLDWRMHLAARSLRQDATPVAALARSLGYSSESAFSTAFKRTMGTSPRNYRAAAGMEELPAQAA